MLKKNTMRQAVINIRIEQETKGAFVEVCDEVGLTTSQAVNVFAIAVTRYGGIPFELKSIKHPNETTRLAIEELQRGEGHFVNNAEELYKELDI